LNRPSPVGDLSSPYQIPTRPYIGFYKLSYAFNSVTAPGCPRLLPPLLYYCGCQRVTQHRSHLFIYLFIYSFIYWCVDSFILSWLLDTIQFIHSCETLPCYHGATRAFQCDSFSYYYSSSSLNLNNAAPQYHASFEAKVTGSRS